MSFSDLMSSGRGPGVIGMLLALVVLVGFGLLFMFAFDEGMQGKDQSIESMIAHDAKVIENLTGGIANGEKELTKGPSLLAKSKELGAVKMENRIREGSIDSLKKGIDSANEAIATKNKDFEAYKDEFRAFIRGNAKGQTMERLETRRGDVYENVTIREVTPIGIQIMHSGGQKRIAFEDLSDEIQDQFQFDPKQKAAAVAVEVATRNEHEKEQDQFGEEEKRKAAEQKKKDAAELREKTIRAIAVKRSRIESLGKEIEGLQKAIPMESMKRISNAPQMKLQLSNKQRELSVMQADVARLQGTL
jgi:hypothetical protein